MRLFRLLALQALLAIAVVGVTQPAAAAPDFPAFTSLVVDPTGVLPEADRKSIDDKLTALQQKNGVQFAVAIVTSLDGEEIEPYANALFRKWGVGQKAVNNGLLLVLAPIERKLRFEVGYGLEGTMTDIQSKLIIENTMVPKLKAGDPAGAIKAGVDQAIGVLTAPKADVPQSATPPAPSTTSSSDSGGNWFVVVFALFIVFWFVGMVWTIVKGIRNKMAGRPFSYGMGRRGSSSGSAFGSSSSSDSFSSSSSSSSSSSDSFSGGGGGDSGGGGASGSY